MDNMKNVVKLLEEQVINKTLSLDGIGQVQQIVNANKELEGIVKGLKSNIEDKSKSLQEANATISQLTKDKSALTTVNQALLAKERTYDENVIEAKYLNLRADEMRDIVNMALRNPVITHSRETMANKFGTTTGADGYNVDTTSTVDNTTENTTSETT